MLLEHLATASGKLIMLGDFNFHVDDTDNPSAMKFLDIVNCFNLAQHITVPTHKDGHTLDLIITRNDEDLISVIDVHDPLISASALGMFASPKPEGNLLHIVNCVALIIRDLDVI